MKTTLARSRFDGSAGDGFWESAFIEMLRESTRFRRSGGHSLGHTRSSPSRWAPISGSSPSVGALERAGCAHQRRPGVPGLWRRTRAADLIVVAHPSTCDRRAVRLLRGGRLKMSARDAARLFGLSHLRRTRRIDRAPGLAVRMARTPQDSRTPAPVPPRSTDRRSARSLVSSVGAR